MNEEDDRRATMDLGLGLWEGTAARYYPYETVIAQDHAILDDFQGEGVVVFLDPASNVLSAYTVDADSVWWEDDTLHLSSGAYIEGSILYHADGTRAREARPLQIFTRWYGFALTFPDAEIWGEEH